MAFSYSTALTTDRDKVRFFIGDTVSGSGPRPSGANFANEELDGLISIGGSWQGAAALACRALATSWMAEAKQVKIGEYSVTYSDRAKLYSEKALEIEGQMANSMTGLFSFHGTTSDGDAIGHMFGKTQWDASPTDWTD